MEIRERDCRDNLNKIVKAVKVFVQKKKPAPDPAAKAPPPLPPPPLPPPLQPAGAPAVLALEQFGFSKCRHQAVGCLRCNPAKATMAIGKRDSKSPLTLDVD